MTWSISTRAWWSSRIDSATRVTRARAAALWARARSAISPRYGCGECSISHDEAIHVTVPADRFPRNTAGVTVHRTILPLPVTRIDDIPVTPLGRSLVDAWDWAHRTRRHGPRGRPDIARRAVIESIRGRRLSTAALRAESAACRVHAGRPALRELLDLVDGGCESEREIWGVTQVLPGPPDLPRWVQQYGIRLADGRRVRLDAAYLEAQVAVELDGAAFHGSREARERDLRRDTALAALGWVVLRFSYARLIADPEGCRREIEVVVRRRPAMR